MKSWFLQKLFAIQYSYWFIPMLMAFAAVFLAATLVFIDIYYLKEIPASLEWLLYSEPEGARALLSTVAGATITVAGVVFSMTILSVSHATGNYGSRLLLNFLKDTRNQTALGTFTATYIYCLLVLRTVSSGDTASGEILFVPHIALLGGIVLALFSVAVLISFIHHVPTTIYIGSVASSRGKELAEKLESGSFVDESTVQISLNFTEMDKDILSDRDGYIQALNLQGLMQYAEQHDLQIQVFRLAGDFVFNNEVLLSYKPSDKLSEKGQDRRKRMLDFFAVGSMRTPSQDTGFLFEELQQTCMRALSPGINDPFTAITCLDWLVSAVARIINKNPKQNYLKSSDGVVRVVHAILDHETLCARIFDPLREHVSRDKSVMLHSLGLFDRLIKVSRNPECTQILKKHVEQYYQASQKNILNEDDQKLIRVKVDSIQAHF